MKASTVLNKAVEVIQQRGHGRHSYVCSDGKVCALGAIFIATGAKPEREAGYLFLNYEGMNSIASENARQELRTYLSKTGAWRDHSDSIPNWNDRSLTNQVIDALTNAAAQAKAKEEANAII